MKTQLFLLLVCCSISLSARAQEPGRRHPELRRDTLPSMITATPEMWFYEQERDRYEDPKQAVRRRAELRAAERSTRLASMQWYGMSNSRPTASVTPWFTIYSPAWVSRGADPYRWTPGGTTYVVLQPGTSASY